MTDDVPDPDQGARAAGAKRPRAPQAPPRRRVRVRPPQIGQVAMGAEGRPAPPRVPNPIVPPKTVARRTLLTLVAIMSFLACLSVAAVSVVADRAEGWQRQIADEVTIQVKPEDGVDMEAAVAARRRDRHAGARRDRGDAARRERRRRRCSSPGSAPTSTRASCRSRG